MIDLKELQERIDKFLETETEESFYQWLKEYQQKRDEAKEDNQMYCPVCEGCGHEECCSATKCQQSPLGFYCEWYLKDLKFGYRMHIRLINQVHKEGERYADLLEWYEQEYNTVYDDVYKPNGDLDDQRSVATEAK